MLPRRSRLSRAAFPSSGAGFRASSPHFSLVWGVSSAGGAAAVVSKKIARRSVDRHLLKRRMLSVLRTHVRPDRYIVAYARTGSLGLPFKVVESELESLLIRVHTANH